MSTFRELAKAAFNEDKKQRDAREAEFLESLAQETRLEFERTFGMSPDSVLGNEATCDGVRMKTSNGSWHVILVCGLCGKNIVSGPCSSLASVGYILSRVAPDGYVYIIHECIRI